MQRNQKSPTRRLLLALRVILLAGMGNLVIAVIFGNCGVAMLPISAPVTLVTRKVQEGNEHRKGPSPESEWNRVGLWYRVSDHPLSYLPKGYGRNLPRTDQAGTWVFDERDGKRLFVPNGGVDGISSRILLADAKKATNWEVRHSLKLTPESLITGSLEH